MSGSQHYFRFYVAVDKVQPSLDRSVVSGGKALLPVSKLPADQFPWVADSAGNAVGLFKETT
jgi:predicted enzyme related to lactoylglutathione lyase